MSDRTEFRLVAKIDPDAKLGRNQVFLEIATSVPIDAHSKVLLDQSLGQHLAHLPPNPFTPFMQSSFAALKDASGARWAGRITLSMLGRDQHQAVEWRLNWLDRVKGVFHAVLRAGVVLEFAQRLEAIEAFADLRRQLALSGSLLVQGEATLPSGKFAVATVEIVRAVDALDLAILDDPESETTATARQRREIDGIPSIIELWSFGEYYARTWFMLAEDVADRFGSVDLKAVESLIQPNVLEGRVAEARLMRGVVVVVNELPKANGTE